MCISAPGEHCEGTASAGHHQSTRIRNNVIAVISKWYRDQYK
jgi:hypothetical protein